MEDMAQMDILLREVELSAFVGRSLAVGSKIEVLWRYEMQEPAVGDRCTVEWDGDDESYTGVITEVERRRVKVKYDEGGETLSEDRERLLDPHNQYAWLSAELQPQGDDGWLLKYEDGEQHSVQFYSADELQHDGIPRHWKMDGEEILQTTSDHDIEGPAYLVFDHALDQAISETVGSATVKEERVRHLEALRDDFHKILTKLMESREDAAVTTEMVEAIIRGLLARHVRSEALAQAAGQPAKRARGKPAAPTAPPPSTHPMFDAKKVNVPDFDDSLRAEIAKLEGRAWQSEPSVQFGESGTWSAGIPDKNKVVWRYCFRLQQWKSFGNKALGRDLKNGEQARKWVKENAKD